MPKLYFRYGTVGSGKSLILLAVAHSYDQQKKCVLLAKPSIDTRTGAMISTRAGKERKVDIDIVDAKSHHLVNSRSPNQKSIACLLMKHNF